MTLQGYASKSLFLYCCFFVMTHLLQSIPEVRNKKTDVIAHPEAHGHVGLLASGPPETAGLPFI